MLFRQMPKALLTRDVYFSVRLETLIKKLGLRGMVRSHDCRNTPTTEDLKWVEEKMQLLEMAGNQKKSASLTATDRKWFSNYLKKNAKKKQSAQDFSASEKKHHVKLPDAYKEFFSKVGITTFENVDGEEGFCVHILSPKQLRIEECRERAAEDGEVFKGLLFATTDHGDAFYFNLSRAGSDCEVRKHDHEVDSYEPYAKNFAECIKRFVGA